MLDRRTRWMQILGRLKQNVPLAEALTGLQPWFKAMLDKDTRPKPPEGVPPRSRSEESSDLRPPVKPVRS